jgi:hypothetical protein
VAPPAASSTLDLFDPTVLRRLAANTNFATFANGFHDIFASLVFVLFRVSNGHNLVIPARFQLGFLPLERGQPALSVKPTACQPA